MRRARRGWDSSAGPSSRGSHSRVGWSCAALGSRSCAGCSRSRSVCRRRTPSSIRRAMEMPPIRYARSGEVNVAYQVTGEGNPLDLVLAPGTLSHLAISWSEPRLAQTFERLSRFARLIRFDKRGTGMSDRVTDAATLEERADDIRAVMDAAGSSSAVILGVSEGGWMGCVFAAMHPTRTRGLIVWGCQARFIPAPDYPWGFAPDEFERRLQELERDWPSRDYVRTWGAGVGYEADES